MFRALGRKETCSTDPGLRTYQPQSLGRRSGLNAFVYLHTAIELYDNCHSMPQVAQAFYQDGSRACTHVVRYENFEADIAILSQAYEWPLDECLRSKPPQNVKVPSGERLTAEQIPATIRRRIESAYAADFVAFNFCTL